jgi:hypothetical protein
MNADAGQPHDAMTTQERQLEEVMKLIRKLRWIGLESEAKELKHVLEGIPSPRLHGGLVSGPHSTD